MIQDTYLGGRVAREGGCCGGVLRDTWDVAWEVRGGRECLAARRRHLCAAINQPCQHPARESPSLLTHHQCSTSLTQRGREQERAAAAVTEEWEEYAMRRPLRLIMHSAQSAACHHSEGYRVLNSTDIRGEYET